MPKLGTALTPPKNWFFSSSSAFSFFFFTFLFFFQAKLRAAGDLLYMLFSSDYRRRKPVPSEFLDFDTLPAPESERPIGDHQNGNELSHSGLKSSIPSQLYVDSISRLFGFFIIFL